MAPATPGASDNIPESRNTRTTEFAKVRPDQLADNPRNPPRRIEDLEDMANVAEYGILQPVLVTTRENFLKDNRVFADVIGDAPYVILAGHRRKAAALMYNLEEVPVHIRHDLSANGGDAIVRLVENLSRKTLDPISEALDYQRLREENGLSVRDIARRVGIPSHAVVSKRLKLLTLPTALQEAIAKLELRVTDAEALGKLDTGELQVQAWEIMRTHNMSVAQAMTEVQRRPRRRDSSDGRQRHSAGDRPGSSHEATDTDASGSELDAAQKSNEARFAVCQLLAKQGPDSDDVTRFIAAYAVQGTSSSWHRDAVRLAHRWLRRAEVGPVDNDPQLYLAAVDPEDVVHVAFVMALASDEMRIRDRRRRWDHRDIAHLSRLEAAGHTLTDWERQRAAEAR
ncbi:ParB/RepB/Spo0J family partition protein [Actinoplanes sp. LDG1-06]|uniref:ParB/RepB/Spo0J family partition protein n=1 Tax=Paractinoplanes ovalisporus TaxID=2810368 RepID=A0ABS2AGJ6_9ACTN|nr:ParB/RepB/Spo0J family partition protein [Actinoplanes ovalisporus]MBM2618940.1 ParB/RepB/Spo0J family partition protein [Actinoplanes ovalisporus]